ncbi:helix-turn-helix domain-containing protein [Albibacillus kandeliae]|uniref:helix-turn-helix domain-containing protein n=1 Tax=Albibacillus kandeliae TaxID=2174228 RepID=UPI001300AD5E|nr:XRE family transcriptional regulator [Albibacillus kandeliae]
MKSAVEKKSFAAGFEKSPSEPVGRQIRELRRSRGLTLTELANAIGRSVGHLSELERGVSPITLDTLDKIARRLDVSISWFFSAPSPEDSPEADFVVRRGNRREINLSQSGVREELLSPHLTGGLEMVLTTFAPGAGTGEEGRERKGEEGGIVMSGQLELRIDGQTILLEAGDSFQLPGKGRHWCHNPGTVDAIIAWSFSNANY